MKHSRNLVRLVILIALISIGLFHMPGGGLQTKTSASKAPGALPSVVARYPIFWSSPPRVGVLPDGRLEVFVVGGDGELWHNRQESGGWSGWYSLGGKLIPPNEDFGVLAVERNSDGHLEVFARGTDRKLWHNWQVSGGWSGWAFLGGPDGGSIYGDPSVAMNAYGLPEVFVRAWSDLAVWHKWLNPSGVWSGWNSLGNDVENWSPAVTSNLDGRLEVFVRQSGGFLSHIWQVTPTGGWSSWNRLGGGIMEDPVVARNADGRLEVFAIGERLWDVVHA